MNDLTYEKCKELKATGFPQRGTRFCKHSAVGINQKCDCKESEIVTRPTLEELIDVCLEKKPTKYSNFSNSSFNRIDSFIVLCCVLLLVR